MGEVVNLHKGNLKHCNYFSKGDELGVEVGRLSICAVGSDRLQVAIDNSFELLISREELAEFLHIASAFVDSKEVYKPDCDLPAMNYED